MADSAVLKGETDMKMTRLIMIILIALASGCATVQHYGPYYGKVVDAETREPLEGAAVLAVFYTQSYGPGGSISHYVDAQEAVTDKDGNFNMPGKFITTFRPLQNFESMPQFTIFKPGYGCYPAYKGVRRIAPGSPWRTDQYLQYLPTDQHVTIELPKLKTRAERLDNISCFPVSVPDEKMQEFIEINNAEAKSLGLDPSHIKGGTK